MWMVALVMAGFMAGIGVMAVVAPARALVFYGRWLNPWGMTAAAALRFVFGFALLLAAPDSGPGWVLRAFGALTILSGALVPFWGAARARRLLDRAARLPRAIVRAAGGAVALAGLGIIAVLLGDAFADVAAVVAAVLGALFFHVVAG